MAAMIDFTIEEKPAKPLVAALSGERQTRVPFWLMRQAGRYLPEYRDVRAKAGGFLNLVFNPELAAEVTMQPLRRFGMDGAILFSDILVVPLALGQKLAFVEGEGPQLDPVTDAKDIQALSKENFDKTLAPVYETVRTIRKTLDYEGFGDTALIGFAGAPWTLACYMVEGGGSRDFIYAKAWALEDPKTFDTLIALLVQATVRYLSHQIEAGAEAVQIFDSWAGVLDEEQFARWVTGPTQAIVGALRQKYPHIPVIGFAKDAGPPIVGYARHTNIHAVSIDSRIPPVWAAEALQPKAAVQGNLDPACLLAGGEAQRKATENILRHLAKGPFVFNLGHGIHRGTPPEHVAALAEQVRAWRS